MRGTAGGTTATARGRSRSRSTGGPAKNVILFIGDGMGESEITLARNYALGAAGEFKGIDSLTFTGDVTTYSVQETNPLVPDYVPDSAATGTAWATGVKTSNERISTSAGHRQGPDRRSSRSPRPAATRPATSRPLRSPTRRRPCSAPT